MSSTTIERLDLERASDTDVFRQEVRALCHEIMEHANSVIAYYSGHSELPPDFGVVVYHNARLNQALHHFQRVEIKYKGPVSAVNALREARQKLTRTAEDAKGAFKHLAEWYKA